MIRSATSAASARGGCASSHLDHGLKFYVIQGGCASSRLISEFSDFVSGMSHGPPGDTFWQSACWFPLNIAELHWEAKWHNQLQMSSRAIETAGPYCAVPESSNKSAASAASLDYVNFQAVIKSAASAASRKPKIKEIKKKSN